MALNTAVKGISAYDKTCIGCKSNKADIMVSAMVQGEHSVEFHDLFLTNEQAEKLAQDLLSRVSGNRSGLYDDI